MEKDEFLKDDFLRELIKRSPLDVPSADFVDRVMETLQISPEIAVVKKPFLWYLQAGIPYTIISLILFLVFITSDLPVFNWVPENNYLINNLLPYLETLFIVLKSAFTTKFVSWVLLIAGSAGMLFFLDRLFSRRTSM